VTDEKPKRERKAKESAQAVEPNSAVFPHEGKINAYGFLFLDRHVQAALGISKGNEYPVIIDKQGDALTIRLKV